jgi:DNA-binding PadR family transcriptional regulator
MPKVAKVSVDRYAILGMLSHEPKYGYELREEITQTIGMFWPEIRFSKIYPTLKKLENEYLVEMEVVKDPKSNRPARKMYSITKGGREVLLDWLSDPHSTTKTNNMFTMLQETMLKVYFGGEMGQEDTIDILEDYNSKISHSEKLLKLAEKNLIENLENDIDHNYYLLIVELGLDFSKNVKKWIEKSIKKLDDLKKSK